MQKPPSLLEHSSQTTETLKKVSESRVKLRSHDAEWKVKGGSVFADLIDSSYFDV